MASVGYTRFRFALVAAMVATITVSTASTITAAESRTVYRGTVDGTVTTHSDGTVLLEFVIQGPAPHLFDIALPALIENKARENGGCTPLHYRAKKISERRCLSAVQPSSVTGWRSGRVKRLASG